jgi:putative multiple sugar transport system substrate-binding protein
VSQIIRGEQSMSILKDKRVIIYQAVKMAEAVLLGKLVPVNAVYNNGVIDVPAYNCAVTVVDAGNWREVLIDT